MISIKSGFNEDFTIQFSIKSRKGKVPNFKFSHLFPYRRLHVKCLTLVIFIVIRLIFSQNATQMVVYLRQEVVYCLYQDNPTESANVVECTMRKRSWMQIWY